MIILKGFLVFLLLFVVVATVFIIKARREGARQYGKYKRYTEEVFSDKLSLAPFQVKEEFLLWDKKYLSPFGLVHVADNAAEWVNDYYGEAYYAESVIEDPQGVEEGRVRVFRGGSYVSHSPDQLRSSMRYYPKDLTTETGRNSGYLSKGMAFIGFRCAKSLAPSDDE